MKKTKDDFIDEIVLNFTLGQTVKDIIEEINGLRNYEIKGNVISLYYEKKNGIFSNEIIIEVDKENGIIKLSKNKKDKETQFEDKYSVTYQEDGINQIIKKESKTNQRNKFGITEENKINVIHLEKDVKKGKYTNIEKYTYQEGKKLKNYTEESMEYLLPTNDWLIIKTENNKTSHLLKIKDSYGEEHYKNLTATQSEELLKRCDDPYKIINYNPYYYKQKDINPYKM